MKKINFIEKLFFKEQIEIIEPSREIFLAYSKKSEKNYQAGKLLLKNNFLEEATTLFYYSMYNKVTSLFFFVGVKCENHAAKIILLKELFSIDNSEITLAKSERINKQYFIDYDVQKNSTKDLMNNVEKFNDELELYVEKLSESKIFEIRKQLKEIYDFKKLNKKIIKELSLEYYNLFNQV